MKQSESWGMFNTEHSKGIKNELFSLNEASRDLTLSPSLSVAAFSSVSSLKYSNYSCDSIANKLSP